MTPETRRQFADDLVRNRYERDRFAKMAAERRSQAVALRKARRWLDALIADGRAAEYRNTRDQYAAEVVRLRRIVK